VRRNRSPCAATPFQQRRNDWCCEQLCVVGKEGGYEFFDISEHDHLPNIDKLNKVSSITIIFDDVIGNTAPLVGTT
jgi:hypothetical protein